jgi:hypothetical protein
MRNKLCAERWAAGLLGGALLVVSGQARAQSTPLCSSFPNPVFISGSSAVKFPLLAVAKALGTNVSIIYQNPDSCLGLADFQAGTPSTENGASPTYLKPDGTTTGCALDSPNPQAPDIGVSDVFPATCGITSYTGTGPNGMNMVEIQGPAQAMDIIAPAASNATSISGEAAYVVFGADATNYVIPQWNVAAGIFTRPQTSGTLNMTAAAIGLAPPKWANATTGSTSMQQKSGTSGIISAVANTTVSPNATVSIAADAALIVYNSTPAGDGGLPPGIKPLAFQKKGQKCGYFPSSTKDTFDKINVRQGRYAIWGPVHFLVPVDTNGKVVGPHAAAAATVMDYFIATGKDPSAALLSAATGTTPTVAATDKQAMIEAEAKPGYVVPWCAMEVSISAEVGDRTAYQSPEPCVCDYETKVGAVSNGKSLEGQTCTACTSNTQCSGSTPTCRYGFCEAR